jgi:hypothetical protein
VVIFLLSSANVGWRQQELITMVSDGRDNINDVETVGAKEEKQTNVTNLVVGIERRKNKRG